MLMLLVVVGYLMTSTSSSFATAAAFAVYGINSVVTVSTNLLLLMCLEVVGCVGHLLGLGRREDELVLLPEGSSNRVWRELLRLLLLLLRF